MSRASRGAAKRAINLVVISALAVVVALAAQADPPPAAAPAPASEKPKVLVLDLEVSGVDASEAKLVNGLVTQSAARFPKYEVISAGDVRQLVQVEADKSAVGCDTSSCLAEVAGALGARWVVFGQLGRLGGLTVVTISWFDTQAGKAVGRQRVEVRDIEQLPPQLDNALAVLMGEQPTPPPAAAPSPLFWTGVVGGGVAAAVALGFGGYALVLDDSLGKTATSPKDKQTALDVGPIAIVVAAAAGAVAVGGGVLAVLE